MYINVNILNHKSCKKFVFVKYISNVILVLWSSCNKIFVQAAAIFSWRPDSFCCPGCSSSISWYIISLPAPAVFSGFPDCYQLPSSSICAESAGYQSKYNAKLFNKGIVINFLWSKTLFFFLSLNNKYIPILNLLVLSFLLNFLFQ